MHKCHFAISIESKNTELIETEVQNVTEYAINNTTSDDTGQEDLSSKSWLYFSGLFTIMMAFLPFVVPDSHNALKEDKQER